MSRSIGARTVQSIISCLPRWYDMNGRFQRQGGKNWILPKDINANRFFRDSHWLEIWRKTLMSPLWDRMEGAWLWTPFSHATIYAAVFKSLHGLYTNNYSALLTSWDKYCTFVPKNNCKIFFIKLSKRWFSEASIIFRGYHHFLLDLLCT